MREDQPFLYYTLQYNRFKKIKPGYPYQLTNGIPIRNELELKVGNFLLLHYSSLQYEPYLSVNSRVYFPDFKLNNLIIEVTSWRHPSLSRIARLKTKFLDYQNKGFTPFLFVPQNCRKFYKEFESFIISDLEELRNALVAQSEREQPVERMRFTEDCETVTS